MTFFKAIRNAITPSLRAFFLILVVVTAAILASSALSGCGARYQPPGEDLWRAL